MTKGIRRMWTVNVAAMVWMLAAAPGSALAQSADLSVTGAWLRPTGARPMTGAFLVIENAGATDRVLVSGSTPAASKLELHEMKMEGSMMRMSPVPQIVVPAKGKVELKPGGLHIMLFELKQKLAVGDTVPLTLTFKDGATVKADAVVRMEPGMGGGRMRGRRDGAGGPPAGR